MPFTAEGERRRLTPTLASNGSVGLGYGHRRAERPPAGLRRRSRADAFKVSDEVLMRSVKGITELITKPGLVNLDFADVKTVMERGGVAMIGLGESDSESKAQDSVRSALRSPLLDVEFAARTPRSSTSPAVRT